MAALRPVHRLNNEVRRGLHRERLFRDRAHPFEIYDDAELYMRYRFRRADLMNLVEMVGDNVSVAERKGSLTPTLQVRIALRFFACGYVRFHPQRETEAMKVVFHAVANFPNVIGCVDCTHVKIATPADNEHEYVNRKNDHTINVQLICDADASIMNCVVRWPGSVHDARILRESPVFTMFETMPRPLEDFILGDSGYMLRDWLLTPYINVANAEQQRYMSSPSKSCDLDPIPTILLKACLDVLIKPITDIINASLCYGFFPDDFKCAHVNPVLKKSTVPKEELNSYRPISNLSFISKILEKVVANRLRSHIYKNGLSNVSQSAYKQFHSTETALLKVHNDINLNIDNGKVTALTLLDLSAAFDTIDHNILITRLSTWYGISGTALSWFTSYLTDRQQAIKIGNCFSDMLPTSCGVPQGSVLGPLLFTLYTTPLSSVIQGHNLDHHLYADDTQIYISLTTPDACRSLNQLRDCLQDVSLWMKNSKLKLNANKTEFIIIGTVTQRAKLDGFFPTHILNQSVTPAPSVSNLGVNFDESFNFKQHISKTCRCCFYHIRDLRRIRRFLSLSVAKTIATALVSSRLDY